MRPIKIIVRVAHKGDLKFIGNNGGKLSADRSVSSAGGTKPVP